MNMFDMLRQAQGGNGIENLARQFGLDRGQTEQVLESVLPAVSAGFKHKTRNSGGLETILRQIQGTSHEDVYEEPDALRRDDVRERGNDILGQIFGSKDVSRSVARRTEQSTGVGADIVKKMLPTITSMVLGGMQQKASRSSDMDGALGGLLGMLGGGGARPSSGGGGLDEILGAVLGGQQPAPQPQTRRRGRDGGGGLTDILGGLLRGKGTQQAESRSRGGGGGLRDIFNSRETQDRRAPQRRGGESIDDLLGGIFGSSPKQRRSTGDANLDGVIGMFDSDGDGKVDMDILRQLARQR